MSHFLFIRAVIAYIKVKAFNFQCQHFIKFITHEIQEFVLIVRLLITTYLTLISVKYNTVSTIHKINKSSLEYTKGKKTVAY